MEEFKVITVALPLYKHVTEKGYSEYEFEKLNKYLAEGYSIVDKLHSVSNGEHAFCENVTFILSRRQR